MKRILIKNKIITQQYVAPVFDEIGNIIQEEIPELYEVGEVISQTQGKDDEIGAWLEQIKNKYSNYIVEYIDITAELEQAEKLQAAMEEISKGIKGIAVFKVKVKEKQLPPSQIAQLFSSSEIKLIIETLSTGSLPLAAALISAYPSDGVLVTEEDKQAVIQAIG